ncbi:uncharacterized protein LOC118277348 [Spodoptera frugiperda]|uniref:Uncharacterized protein LOC118277348 n=1 Tax=Spodoptera frugiperda TaxID=7108 RepID=A0A9R0DG38_SPOFR|nr:uncharacterized protein LOC118277348 [Spodoptera frugiperda]
MMGTKHEPVLSSQPANNESDDEAPDSAGSEAEEEEVKQPANNVANILKRLQSSGALIKKPKQEYRCYTCDEDFRDWEELENHIIQHVSLPSVVLVKLPSDDEEEGASENENWSDEEDEAPPPKVPQKVTPTKIDISQLLKKGISVKKPADNDNKNDAALSKLSGLGFTIKKGNTPVKTEPEKEANTDDFMQKLGKLGGIKLKLKSDGNNSNSFKVINGLKDFNASDDEGQESGNDDSREDFDEEPGDNESDGDNERSPPNIRKTSESDDSAKSAKIKPNSLKNLQGVSIKQKEPQTPLKVTAQQNKPPGRPAVKQTPKRGANLPLPAAQEREVSSTKSAGSTPSSASTPERRESHSSMDNVVVKQEVEAVETQSSNVPIFSTQHQIKSERASPPVPTGDASTPILAKVKSEPDALASHQNAPNNSVPMPPLLPVTKKEEPSSVTVIEINGDSNDEDDDCCVVSATPAPDVKPVVPKTENPPVSYPPPTYPTTQASSYSSSTMLNTRLTAPSLEKQHNFNWNAPDSKPPIDMLEKSADDIFNSLLTSSSAKKEGMSISDASEYISLDTLGPQHSCDVCNTRFTDIGLLDDHRRITGHTKTLALPSSSSTLMPYSSSSNILSSILPVKQLADQVGKLSTISGSGPGFTHQQNVMINIQAYPGAGGMMMNPQGGYNSYPPAQNVQPDYGNNMYGQPQQMPGQYPGQNYMGQQNYGQFQQPMNKPGPYPNTMQQGQFPPSSSPYSTATPLQGMQQAVYGQAPSGGMNVQLGQPLGQMGPPGSPYVPTSSPGGAMKPPSGGVKIQNVQTFPPGQPVGMPGSEQMAGPPAPPGPIVVGQMPGQTQIRMAPGANITRPRMAAPRGPRPGIRPGIQVHAQVRGQKAGVRMPMKRPPAQMAGGPGQKRRTDMLLPGKHDNEDCQVMAMQKQREGLPMIHSVQGAKDKFNLGSQISITKKTVNKEANAMANVLASRGISVKQKQKSRSPTPERPAPYIPNLGAGVSIKHTSKSSNFSIPEAKVGGGMMACKICKKMFMNHNSLAVHMSNAHPQSKVPVFKCDECPASYPKSLQLQHHKRVFHNVTGPNRELGLPVVDLSQEDNLKRLSNLGIYSFIPLANREQAGGCFGIPVISVHNVQNGTSMSLQALGADGLLSLGPLKPLPNS